MAPTDLQALQARPRSAAEWSAVLAVFAEQAASAASAAAMPPMSGTWRVVDDRLRFEPRFPLSRRVRYRAEYRPAHGVPIVSFYSLPEDRTAPTTLVAQVYPSADVLPENQLKFYVQFSAPMSRGAVYEHVRVRDARGAVIELPFLELDQELWDPTMTRLTLLIDPGRIKRGVKPLEDIGAVFESGRKYSLTVDAAFQDAAGRPLKAGFEKTFSIVTADREPPDPRRWKVTAPAAGSRAPLSVVFDEPMDWALARRMIGVAAERDGPLAGESSLGSAEREWRFVPAQPWQRGPHRVVIPTTIEDLAGNNIGKTFDVDVFEGVHRRIESINATVAFEVK